jgi:arylsulfatase A-like enzyme
MLLDDKKWGSGHNAFFGYADGTNRNTLKRMVKPYECAEVDDTAYVDGLTANLAIKKLGELKKRGKPFFLGVGFFKPHLPFTAPQKYWDLYNEDKIPLAPFRAIPANSSRASLHGSGEFNQYKLGEEKASLDKNVSDEYARKIRHAYFACVSFVDAQIGKVLDELERQGLAENTIVVLWGDHGWHLGDQMVWGKHTIFERALQSPLIIRVPRKQGAEISKIVSTTDIYPTLMELCGTRGDYKLDGESLTRLMENPGDKTWRNTAYSYYRNGISVRTKDYRLMKYYRKQQPEIELYNHNEDPNETKNIATENPEIVKELLPVLEVGNTGLYDK